MDSKTAERRKKLGDWVVKNPTKAKKLVGTLYGKPVSTLTKKNKKDGSKI